MRGGHNIKSINEKKLNGTYRADRDLGRLESTVTTASEIPKPPKNFDSQHVEKWNEICQKIIDLGVFAIQDYDAIVSYVKNWAISETAWQDVVENGQTLWIETANGQKPITNPSLSQFHEAEMNMKRLFSEFGLTPRARMGIRAEAPKKKKESPILALMSSKKKTEEWKTKN